MSHGHIDYIELPAADLEATKSFFSAVFKWEFVDYGPDYASFTMESAGMNGGFYRAPLQSRIDTGGALVVIFSADIEATQSVVEGAGGQISKALFDFPGGRRFHFIEPSGNELAVWAAPA